MHIALFSPAWPLERSHNGIVTFVHWTSRELERLGHRVTIVTPVWDGPAGIRVERLRHRPFDRVVERITRRFSGDRGYPWNIGRVIARTLMEVHRRDPIDVVEMEESFGWSADVEAVTGLPLLTKLHGPAFLSMMEDELLTPSGQERIEREGRALARCGAIASPATDTLVRTCERYGLEPPISAHVVNPVEVHQAVALWDVRTADPGELLFVGRFDRRKGADIVLEAFARLLQERPDLTLTIVGPDSGLAQDDGTRMHFEAFRDRVLPPEKRDRVRFLGHLANDRIAELRCRARAVIVASRWENQGYTMLEAMLQGCPIVASEVGGNPESIVDDKTGLLFRSGDPIHLASQLGVLLDQRDMAAALGAAARAHVIEHHSTARIAEQSLELYDRLIARRRAR